MKVDRIIYGAVLGVYTAIAFTSGVVIGRAWEAHENAARAQQKKVPLAHHKSASAQTMYEHYPQQDPPKWAQKLAAKLEKK